MSNSQTLLDLVRSRSFETASGCWVWPGPFQRSTPVVRHGGKVIAIRRALIPEAGDRVRSTCGERLCVRPDHLGNAPPSFETYLQRWVGTARPALTDCWTFLLGDGFRGANVTWQGRHRSARAVVFEQLVGHAPARRLLATCGNPQCINPYHALEDGDQGEPGWKDADEMVSCVEAILDGDFEGLAPPFDHGVIRAALEIVQGILADELAGP